MDSKDTRRLVASIHFHLTCSQNISLSKMSFSCYNFRETWNVKIQCKIVFALESMYLRVDGCSYCDGDGWRVLCQLRARLLWCVRVSNSNSAVVLNMICAGSVLSNSSPAAAASCSSFLWHQLCFSAGTELSTAELLWVSYKVLVVGRKLPHLNIDIQTDQI